MNKIELEEKAEAIATATEKATYIIDDLVNRYGIADVAQASEKDRKIYAYECGRIFNYMSILRDYIAESREAIQELKNSIR